MKLLILPIAIAAVSTLGANTSVLFDGKNLKAFELAKNSWEIEADGSMVCRMQETKDKNGKVRLRGMGYIWTKADYSDFELTYPTSFPQEQTLGSSIVRTSPILFRQVLKFSLWITKVSRRMQSENCLPEN